VWTELQFHGGIALSLSFSLSLFLGAKMPNIGENGRERASPLSSLWLPSPLLQRALCTRIVEVSNSCAGNIGERPLYYVRPSTEMAREKRLAAAAAAAGINQKGSGVGGESGKLRPLVGSPELVRTVLGVCYTNLPNITLTKDEYSY